MVEIKLKCLKAKIQQLKVNHLIGLKISDIIIEKWKAMNSKLKPKDKCSDSLGKKMSLAKNVTSISLIGNNFTVMNTLVMLVDWLLPNLLIDVISP